MVRTRRGSNSNRAGHPSLADLEDDVSEALKPCVCGKKPSIERSGPGNLVWYIECDAPLTDNAEHTVSLQCGGTRAEAVAAWNHRPVEDALVEALKAAEVMLRALLVSMPYSVSTNDSGKFRNINSFGTLKEVQAALKLAGE